MMSLVLLFLQVYRRFSYPFDKAGESGADVLLELIEGKPQVMSKVVLTFQNIQRETC